MENIGINNRKSLCPVKAIKLGRRQYFSTRKREREISPSVLARPPQTLFVYRMHRRRLPPLVQSPFAGRAPLFLPTVIPPTTPDAAIPQARRCLYLSLFLFPCKTPLITLTPYRDSIPFRSAPDTRSHRVFIAPSWTTDRYKTIQIRLQRLSRDSCLSISNAVKMIVFIRSFRFVACLIFKT